MRNFRSSPAQRRDHYQELTDKIIAALEAGTAPWRRPWDKAACGGATSPVNAATGHRYRGINLFVLGMSPLSFRVQRLVQLGESTRASEEEQRCFRSQGQQRRFVRLSPNGRRRADA